MDSPATAANQALIMNATILKSEVLIPDPSAFPSSSRIAIRPSLKRDRRMPIATATASTVTPSM